MTVKVAIICSGHARMVPWGWKLIQNLAQEVPSAKYTVYSWLWSDRSDNRMNTVTDIKDDWRWPEASKEIFKILGHRHAMTDQGPIMDQLYRDYLAADSLPPDDINESFYMPRHTFDRFNGQLVGFIHAIDQWREELKEYDWIIRSRWDMAVDPEVVRLMLNPTDLIWAPTFYTKYVDITHGQVQISGDTIYGPRSAWLDIIPSWTVCQQRLIEGTQARWHWIRRNCRQEDLKDPYYQKYYQQGWWFNSHFLWTTLFTAHPSSIIRSRGESYGLHPSLSRVPLAEFEYGHAAQGPDWRPHGALPRPRTEIIEDQADLVQNIPVANQVIQDQRRQRQQQRREDLLRRMQD